MSVTDLLFNGNPPPSVTSYGTATTNLPQWYSDYVQGVMATGNAVAAEPYQQYGGPRVADFTPQQQQAFNQIQALQGQQNPNMNHAINTVYSATTTNPLSQATPYMEAAQAANPSAAASGLLDQASSINASGNAQPFLQRASTMSPADAASGLLGQAAQVNPSMAASGYLDQASQTAPQVIGDYMNPYTTNVVNRIGELAGRNLSENLMPAIGDTFTRAGQFGGSRQQEMTGRALRDTQESALAAQQQALQQGYGQSMASAQTDLARQAQLGQTAGGLAAQQQSNLANIGSTTGNLTAQGQQNLTNIGQVTGNLANTQQSNMGALASTTGNLASANQNALANMGQVAGNLQNANNVNLVNAGNAVGNLSNIQQSQQLKDTAALQDVGAQQQALNQQNLNVGYQDFRDQVNYPRDQLGFESNLVRGFQIPTSENRTQTSPQTNNMTPGAQSGLTSLASGLSGLSGILGRAKGGRVGKPKKKHTGALALARR